jgi:hypothetical protein
MQQAGLWSRDFIDDREWWDSNGDLNGAALFGHGLFALGQVKERARRAAPAILRSKLETSLAIGIVLTLADDFFQRHNSGGLE